MENTLIGAGVGGMILAGALLILSLVIIVLWILLPFAVFGLKARLDQHTELLGNVVRILDPDGSKWAAYNAHEAAKEAARKAAIQQCADAGKAAEEKARADKKLRRTQTEIRCPACNLRQTISDLRAEVRHTCQGCKAEIVFEG